MSDFVSGGQITMHSIRMFGQVMQKLYLGAVIGFVVISMYWFFESTTAYDRHMLRSWLEAEVKINMHGEDNPNLDLVKIKYNKKYILKSSGNHEFAPVETGVLEFMRYCHKRYRESLVDKIYESLKIGLWGSISTVLLLIIFFKRRGIVGRVSKYVRGGQIACEKDLVRHIKIMNKEAKEVTHRIGGIPYPYKSQEQNTLIIGATGSGKTQLISDLVDQIRARGEKLIIYDKKGDYLSWFYDKKKDFILNPFDKRGENWNLLNEIDHSGMIKTIAESFIPARGDRAGENKIWDDAARLAFSEIAKKVIKENGICSNLELVDTILQKDPEDLAEYVKNTDAQGIINMDSKKTAMSVIFVLATQFNSLRLTNGDKDDSFSIRKWLREEDRNSTLFITNQSKFDIELAPLQTAWFEIAINGILSGKQNNKQKTWIIMDELATIHKIPSLQRGLAAGRSYGSCFVLGIQNISQLRDIYGMHSASNISSECNTRCIFKANDPETAKWVSDNLGQEEIIENRRSLSYGASEVRDGVNVSNHNKIRTLVLPSEIQNMDRLELYIKMVDCPIVKKKLKYKERKIIEPDGFISNEKAIENMADIKTAHEVDNSKDKLPVMGYPFKMTEEDLGEKQDEGHKITMKEFLMGNNEDVAAENLDTNKGETNKEDVPNSNVSDSSEEIVQSSDKASANKYENINFE